MQTAAQEFARLYAELQAANFQSIRDVNQQRTLLQQGRRLSEAIRHASTIFDAGTAVAHLVQDGGKQHEVKNPKEYLDLVLHHWNRKASALLSPGEGMGELDGADWVHLGFGFALGGIAVLLIQRGAGWWKHA